MAQETNLVGQFGAVFPRKDVGSECRRMWLWRSLDLEDKDCRGSTGYPFERKPMTKPNWKRHWLDTTSEAGTLKAEEVSLSVDPSVANS